MTDQTLKCYECDRVGKIVVREPVVQDSAFLIEEDGNIQFDEVVETHYCDGKPVFFCRGCHTELNKQDLIEANK